MSQQVDSAAARWVRPQVYNPCAARPALCSQAEWAAARPVFLELIAALVAVKDTTVDGVPQRALAGVIVWAQRQGLPTTAGVLFSTAVVDAYIATLKGSHATIRSALRRFASLHGVPATPTTTTYPKLAKQVPYTRAQIDALLLFAKNLSNELRRSKLTGFILLGAACGAQRGELRDVTPSDVHKHQGRLHVALHGRCVPVLDEFHREFASYLTRHQKLFGNAAFVTDSRNRNVVAHIPTWINGRKGVENLSGSRLRSYFVCRHLENGTGVHELMRICGMQTLHGLERYYDLVPVPATTCSKVGVA